MYQKAFSIWFLIKFIGCHKTLRMMQIPKKFSSEKYGYSILKSNNFDAILPQLDPARPVQLTKCCHNFWAQHIRCCVPLLREECWKHAKHHEFHSCPQGCQFLWHLKHEKEGFIYANISSIKTISCAWFSLMIFSEFLRFSL